MKCRFCGQETKTTVCSYCGYDNVYGDAFEDIADNSASYRQTYQGPYAYDARQQEDSAQSHKQKTSYEKIPYANEQQQSTTAPEFDSAASAPARQKNYFNLAIFIIILLFIHPYLAFLYFIVTKVIMKSGRK